AKGDPSTDTYLKVMEVPASKADDFRALLGRLHFGERKSVSLAAPYWKNKRDLPPGLGDVVARHPELFPAKFARSSPPAPATTQAPGRPVQVDVPSKPALPTSKPRARVERPEHLGMPQTEQIEVLTLSPYDAWRQGPRLAGDRVRVEGEASVRPT